MCGICGIFDRAGASIDASQLTTMRDVMLTRGPDAAGAYFAPHIALGHRRLSIIDLSPAGNNPMPNEDGTVQIVLNGEIYNFLDLRPELEAAGHVFRSRSDTEVLIHGYEEWGIDGLLRRIRGMYAFAIWDARNRELILARDRVGKKPLFVYDDRKTVLFASDIKSIWTLKRDGLTLDPKAIDEFLFNYYIQQDRSIYREVWKVQPAEYVVFSTDADQTRRAKYWSVSYADKQIKTESEWIDGLEHHLRRAVRQRMIADVPLGAFLSGGVDSSAVAAFMARESGSPINTFTIGFENIRQYDERAHAKRVADHIGSNHTEIVLEPDVWAVLPYLVWHYGEPFGDASAVPTYFVSKAAREYVTVVLTGDGGDETLAGYDRHLSADRARRMRHVPGVLRRHLIPAVARSLAANAPDRLQFDRAALFAEHMAGRLDLAVRRSSVWRDHRRERLWQPDWFNCISDWHPAQPQIDALGECDGPTPLDHRLQMDMNCTLPSDYLVKVDVASMAASLEARCPFLDTDLIEFAACIPADMLLADGELKHLGKKLATRHVPHDSIYRRKWGFGLPIGHWMRDEWHARVRRMLLDGPAAKRGMFDLRFVERILDEHRDGHADHRFRLWTLLILEIWQQIFIDRTLNPGDTLPR